MSRFFGRRERREGGLRRSFGQGDLERKAYLPRRVRNNPAQGNALGDENHRGALALKGRHIGVHTGIRTRYVAACFALSGLTDYAASGSQGVALG